MFDEYPLYLSVQECCELLSVEKHAVYQLINDGSIKAFKTGEHQWRIVRKSLAGYVLRQAGIAVEDESEVDEFV